jgi:hypothetical protein
MTNRVGSGAFSCDVSNFDWIRYVFYYLKGSVDSNGRTKFKE